MKHRNTPRAGATNESRQYIEEGTDMGKIDKDEVMGEIEGNLPHDADELEANEAGQLVIYTGIWRWADGTYHDQPEETG